MNQTDTELKQSNFRKTIVADDFGFAKKKVALAGGLTIALLFITLKVPYAAYLTYPVVLLTKTASETVANLAILAYLVILSYLLLWFFVFRKRPVPRIPHLPCPYCDENVELFRDWECDKCGKSQGFRKYITEGCRRCGKMSEMYYCEHCDLGFLL